MDKNPDMCDTSLSLGLHFKGRRSMSTDRPPKRILPVKHEPPVSNPCLVEPSLILGLPTDVYQSNPVKAEVKSSPEASLVRSSSYSTSSLSKVMNEEAEEDEDGSARKKLRLTKEQSALLEDRFKEHSTLNPKQKQALAKQLNLRPRQVEVWFQNRRARTKMKQTEVDCEFLRRCCETLADENRRLQRELRELKAVKLAPPWCMQFPGAAPTVCPRCERVTGSCDGSKAGPFTHPAAC